MLNKFLSVVILKWDSPLSSELTEQAGQVILTNTSLDWTCITVVFKIASLHFSDPGFTAMEASGMHKGEFL